LPPTDLDGLSHADLKNLVLKLFEDVAELTRGPTAGVALQRLHEFCGAGSGDPSARREFPLRALAATNDSAAAGRHQRAFRAGPAPLFARSIYIRGKLTVARPLALVRAFGIVISKRQLVRLLIAGPGRFP
jgi:hypothetical protein